MDNHKNQNSNRSRGGGSRRGGQRGGKQQSNKQAQNSVAPIELPYTENCTYIDTHVHLEYILEKISQKNGLSNELPMDQILQKFPAHANFEGCIAVFCDAATFSPSLSIWQEFLIDPRIWGAFGLHPHSARYYSDKLESQIVDVLQNDKAIAWGECGLDFAKMHSDKQVQMDVFARQVKAAVKIGKPIMIHSRKAPLETFDILLEHAPKQHPIHLHCFGDKLEDAKRYLAHFERLYLGFTGMITWEKSEELRQVVEEVPLERILLETDGPYHFPGNNSKALNHSGTIPAIAAEIAKIKQIPIETVYLQIRENTRDVYGI